MMKRRAFPVFILFAAILITGFTILWRVNVASNINGEIGKRFPGVVTRPTPNSLSFNYRKLRELIGGPLPMDVHQNDAPSQDRSSIGE